MFAFQQLQINAIAEAAPPQLDRLMLFGFLTAVVTLFCYWEQNRRRSFLLPLAIATVGMAAYGFMQGAWPLGLVAIVWAAGTFRRWRAAKTPAAQAMKPTRHLTNASLALTKTESRLSRLFGPMRSNHDM